MVNKYNTLQPLYIPARDTYSQYSRAGVCRCAVQLYKYSSDVLSSVWLHIISEKKEYVKNTEFINEDVSQNKPSTLLHYYDIGQLVMNLGAVSMERR